jgi:hypothetical protein
LEIVFHQKVIVDCVQQLAIRMDKIAADFTLEVKVFPAA